MAQDLLSRVLDVNVVLRHTNELYDQFLGIKEGGYGFDGGQNKGERMRLELVEIEAMVGKQGVKGRDEISKHFTGFLMRMLLSSKGKSGVERAVKSIKVNEGVLRVCFAIELYKLEHGKYPAGLGDVVGMFGVRERPRDLLIGGGALLRYEIDKDGEYRVWSPGVGEEGRDREFLGSKEAWLEEEDVEFDEEEIEVIEFENWGEFGG